MKLAKYRTTGLSTTVLCAALCLSCASYVHAQNTSAKECLTYGTAAVAEQTTEIPVTSDNTQTPTQSIDTTKIRSCTATSDSRVKLTWDKIDQAAKYEIYRCTSKKGNYKKIAATKKTSFTDRSGKALVTYYYRIKAISNAPQTFNDSALSKAVSIKVRKKAKKIAFVGDSIMVGFRGYHVVTGKENRAFAKVGIHAGNFYTSDYMKNLLKYKPDRMFIMLGMNSLVGSPSDSHLDGILSSYNKILNACHKKNPNMEIIVMGVSPTRGNATVKNSTVVRFNKKLKASVKNRNYIHYFDTCSVLADGSGALQSGYGGGDGIHWSKSGYDATYKKLQEFIKEW